MPLRTRAQSAVVVEDYSSVFAEGKGGSVPKACYNFTAWLARHLQAPVGFDAVPVPRASQTARQRGRAVRTLHGQVFVQQSSGGAGERPCHGMRAFSHGGARSDSAALQTRASHGTGQSRATPGYVSGSAEASAKSKGSDTDSDGLCQDCLAPNTNTAVLPRHATCFHLSSVRSLSFVAAIQCYGAARSWGNFGG